MRFRVGLVTGLAVLMSTGLSGVASGATVPKFVNPGSVWTIQVNGGGCEVMSFLAGATNTFTADSFGDSGTYTGGGDVITVTWTAGVDAGVVFTGKYSFASGTYTGPIGAGSAGPFMATLTPGASAGC